MSEDPNDIVKIFNGKGASIYAISREEITVEKGKVNFSLTIAINIVLQAKK